MLKKCLFVLLLTSSGLSVSVEIAPAACEALSTSVIGMALFNVVNAFSLIYNEHERVEIKNNELLQ